MKNKESWTPTKYVLKKNQLRASRNTAHVTVSSRLMVDLIAAAYQKHMHQHVKGRLVDLGCGFVPLYEAYKGLISDNICVDWANSLHKNQHLDIECDLNTPLPLESAQFDTILISDVLEHIANPDGIWAEMARILKPGGKILISVPFLYCIHEAPHDYFRYSEFSLRNFAVKNNLQVVELIPLGGAPEVITDIMAKNVLRLPLGKIISRFVQRMCRFFVWTRWGKKFSVKSAKNFPIGYFLVVQKPELA